MLHLLFRGTGTVRGGASAQTVSQQCPACGLSDPLYFRARFQGNGRNAPPGARRVRIIPWRARGGYRDPPRVAVRNEHLDDSALRLRQVVSLQPADRQRVLSSAYQPWQLPRGPYALL